MREAAEAAGKKPLDAKPRQRMSIEERAGEAGPESAIAGRDRNRCKEEKKWRSIDLRDAERDGDSDRAREGEERDRVTAAEQWPPCNGDRQECRWLSSRHRAKLGD